MVLTVIMGLTRQVPTSQPATDFFGFSRMLSFWPFVLVYGWMTFTLGLVSLKRMGAAFSHKPSVILRRDIPFLLNHFGLFVAITSATLGNADMKRVQMTIGKGAPEWCATDDEGLVHELPVAIKLLDFRIDEYPPKLALIESKTDTPPSTLLLDNAFTTGQIGEWRITLNQYYDYAEPVVNKDSTSYAPSNQTGAVTAVHITANNEKGEAMEGWLTDGSYKFPSRQLELDHKTALVMLPREPRRYVSQVEIVTKTGKDIKTDILVNNPVTVDGWIIYQLGYDNQMGRWSETSVLELVSDPWLPAVYAGIFMMLAGAVCMAGIKEK